MMGSRKRRPWALRSLPVLPQVGAELLKLLNDQETPIGRIGDLVRRDPALAAEVLRGANSSLSAQRTEVREIGKAIVVLGTEQLRRLAWTSLLRRVCPQGSEGPLHLCWRHSVASALIGEELAKATGGSAELTFAACLLHDIGRLALLVCYPQEYGELLRICDEANYDPLVCEQELFDIDHCRAGRWLAEKWNLPSEFRRAAGEHHDAAPTDSTLVSTVVSACQLASALGFSVIPRIDSPSIEDSIDQLAVPDPPRLLKALEGVPGRVERFCH